MDNWQPSTLSWSSSRKVHFESCKRYYFYHRFWGQDPKLRWLLFEMRNITTLTMLRGLVVHAVIARALNMVRLDQTVNAKIAKAGVTELIREKYQESYKRLWHIDNRPPGRKASEITNLLEHYYKSPGISERAREAQQVAWKCVENLIESSLWNQITNASPSEWQVVEDESFPSFDLDGIRVYAKIDFAHSIGSPTIIDWKTGSPSPDDRKQLILYSLYAQSKWDWDPLDTRPTAAYLQPELTLDEFKAAPEEIEATKTEVKRSFDEMLELEPAFGPAKMEDFPLTEDATNCRWCRFQGICEGAKRS